VRILLATHFFPPSQAGGTESYTFGLARALRRYGHEPFVLCAGSLDAANGWPPSVEDDVYDGIPVRRLSWNWHRAPDPITSFYENSWAEDALQAYVKLLGVDVVHITSCYSLGAGIVRVARESRCRTILTLTDFWFLCIKHTLLRGDGTLCEGPKSSIGCQKCLASSSATLGPLMRLASPDLVAHTLLAATRWPALIRLRGLRGYVGDAEPRLAYLAEAFSHADTVLAPSRFLKEMFVRNGYQADSIQVSPHGYDLAWGPRSEPRSPDGTISLGYLGQLEPLKGVDVAVQAVLSLDREVPIRLRVYGSLEKNPSYVRSLQQVARNDDRIEFLGPYQREHLADILADLDAVMVPSLWYENAPLVIGEAFSALRPVLATNLGGMGEAVQHEVNGLLFERGDVAGAAAVMRRLVDEPGLLARLRAGIRPVRTIDDEISGLLDIYRGTKVPALEC
jgi:glycosyltransferase involved in cell wall biosynthesis